MLVADDIVTLAERETGAYGLADDGLKAYPDWPALAAFARGAKNPDRPVDDRAGGKVRRTRARIVRGREAD